MADDTKDTVRYKIRYTPVRDFLRSGFTASLDPLRHLREAMLPLPIEQLIERVVQRTRLWRQEKLDVLTELIAHFREGIASGVAPEDLVRAFGDETRAAQLIRRAKRRNRPLYWHSFRAAALFTLISLLIGTPLLLVSLHFDNLRWGATTQRIDSLKVEAEKRKAADRTVFRQPTLPGNAWDEYNIALGGVSSADYMRDGRCLQRYWMDYTSDDPELKCDADKLISANAWRLDHLRQGAQRADGQMPYSWGYNELGLYAQSRMLATLGAAQAKRLADSGRSQEAENILLDVVVFGKDLTTNGRRDSKVTSDVVYEIALESFLRFAVAGKFSTMQMTSLSKTLETIDREFPRRGPMTSETIREGLFLVAHFNDGVGAEDWWSDSKKLGWRFAISPRGYKTAAFEEIERYSQRFDKLEDLPYAEARTEAAAIAAEARKSPYRDFVPNFSELLDVGRGSRAMLRLLRASIAVLTTGKVPALSDPYGTNILSESNAEGITVWSLGKPGTAVWIIGKPRTQYGANQSGLVINIPRSSLPRSIERSGNSSERKTGDKSDDETRR